MGESSESIRIGKLKGSENWTSWYDDIQSTLTLRKLWSYASGRIVKPILPTEPSPAAGTSSSESAEATAQGKYDKDVVVYQENLVKWEESQEMIMAIIKLSCETGPRVHLTNITDGKTALGILKKLYGGTDLSTIDISYREISRSNLENFSNLEDYSEHLKKHREKIIQAGETISDWQMASAFRMGLPSRLNPYVFQLVHAAKTSGKELTIDEMVAALVAEEKRTEYDENAEDAKARAVKNQNNQKGGGKSTDSNPRTTRKKKQIASCSYCKGLSHN